MTSIWIIFKEEEHDEGGYYRHRKFIGALETEEEAEKFIDTKARIAYDTFHSRNKQQVVDLKKQLTEIENLTENQQKTLGLNSIHIKNRLNYTEKWAHLDFEEYKKTQYDNDYEIEEYELGQLIE